MASNKMNPINPLDDYCWNDFLQEFQEQPNLSDMETIVEHYRNRLSRVLVKVNDGDSYFLKKDSKFKLFNRVEKIPDEMIQWCIIEFNQKTGEIQQTWRRTKLKKIYEDGIGNRIFTVYNDTTWRPTMNYSGRELNLWTGFKAQHKPSDWTYNEEKVTPILKYIKETICNNNEQKYKWLISWFHHCFTKAEEKTGVCPILYSPQQGTGKGIFTAWLVNHMYGNDIAEEITGLSKLVQKHNTVRERKCFTPVDEASTVKGDFHSTFDVLKNAITASRVMIERKCVNAYSIEDFCNFMICTNNLHSVKIESTDRRFMIFDVNASRLQDNEYYDDIRLNHLTEDGARHFFEYLTNLDKKELVDPRKVIDCKVKKNIKDLSRPITDRFFEAINSRTWEIDVGQTHLIAEETDEEWKFSRSNLYKIFTNWCSESGEPTIRQALFFIQVAEKGLAEYVKGKERRWILKKPEPEPETEEIVPTDICESTNN
jgi:uncharacterized protein YrzB (UPF0473 family)